MKGTLIYRYQKDQKFDIYKYFVANLMVPVIAWCDLLVHNKKCMFDKYLCSFCFQFQHLKKKNRVKVIEYFLDVGKECINIGNFNSLIAIIAGLNMSQVSRLKKTVSKHRT